MQSIEVEWMGANPEGEFLRFYIRFLWTLIIVRKEINLYKWESHWECGNIGKIREKLELLGKRKI